MACIVAGIIAVSKAIDYGWTAWDLWQSGRTINSSSASQAEKMMAGLNIGMAVLFEVVEPDDYLPVGLPIDDVARKAFMKGANEALEAGGEEGLELYIRDQLGDNADTVLNKMDELLGTCFNSFEAGTWVETANGPVPIEEIEVGTYVLGYDEETGEIGYYPVTHLISHLDFKVVYLTIDGEVIVTTAEHPFYTAEGEWVDAIDLRVGDEIRTAEWTTGVVSSVYEVTRPQPMYNFTVGIAHTYFVGNAKWLVHNTDGFCMTSPTSGRVLDDGHDYKVFVDRSFTWDEMDGMIDGINPQYEQADGSLVRYVRNQNGNYDVIITRDSDNFIITAIRDMTPTDMNNKTRAGGEWQIHIP